MKCRQEGHGWKSCAKVAAAGTVAVMAQTDAPAQAKAETASVAASEAETCSTLVQGDAGLDHHGGGCFGCESQPDWVPPAESGRKLTVGA